MHVCCSQLDDEPLLPSEPDTQRVHSALERTQRASARMQSHDAPPVAQVVADQVQVPSIYHDADAVGHHFRQNVVILGKPVAW